MIRLEFDSSAEVNELLVAPMLRLQSDLEASHDHVQCLERKLEEVRGQLEDARRELLEVKSKAQHASADIQEFLFAAINNPRAEKVRLIKHVRALTGLDLLGSKNLVEAVFTKIGISSVPLPERNNSNG